MWRTWLRACEPLLLAGLLAGCSSPSFTLNPEAGPAGSGEEPAAEPVAAAQFAEGVVPASFRVTQAEPASRQWLLLPARTRPAHLARLGRPRAVEVRPTLCSPNDPPAAELLPVLPSGALGMSAAANGWRFAGQSAGDRLPVELEAPQAFPTATPEAASGPAGPWPEAIASSPAPTQPRTLDLSRVEVVRRQVSTDPTAHPAFAHAADYSWLVGVLQQEPGEEGWTVHYAGRDAEDQFDGVLALVGGTLSSDFRPGQLVRVEGELVDPAPHELKPAYHVRAIQQRQRP